MDKTTILMILTIMSVAVFLTNIIVEVIKELDPLKDIPTNIVVLVVAQFLVNLGTYAYLDFKNISIIWYYIPIIIMIGVVVAYLAMYGWEKFIQVWQKSKYPKKG